MFPLNIIVLGSLLFDIDLIDLSFECQDDCINSYMCDTPYSYAKEMFSVMNDLQRIAKKV